MYDVIDDRYDHQSSIISMYISSTTTGGHQQRHLSQATKNRKRSDRTKTKRKFLPYILFTAGLAQLLPMLRQVSDATKTPRPVETDFSTYSHDTVLRPQEEPQEEMPPVVSYDLDAFIPINNSSMTFTLDKLSIPFIAIPRG